MYYKISQGQYARDVKTTNLFKEESPYAAKLKNIVNRRKLATKEDLENSQLIADIRVNKTQPKAIKPNKADKNLASIMLYGHRYDDLSNEYYIDDNLNTIPAKGTSSPEQMQLEAETLAYRILNDLMFDIQDLVEFADIMTAEYANALTTNANPIKEFFENDIFDIADTTTLFKGESPVSLSTSPQVQALEEAGFNSVDIYNISKSLLYTFLNEAVKTINKNNNTGLVFIRDFGDIQTYLNKETVEKLLDKISKNINDLQKENIEIIRQNIDLFIREEDDVLQGTIVDILKATKVSLNTEEEYKDAVDSNDDLQSIKSPFEFSSLDSATMATRLLFEMIPLKTENGERVRDPRTGLSILADGSYIYNKLQESLSDIDHIYDNEGMFISAMDQMKEKIKDLALSVPVFQGFDTNLLDKLTEQQLSQFFRVMNMKNYNFRALITSSSVKIGEAGEQETSKYVRFINASAQSLLYRTKDSWVENSKIKLFAYNEENNGIIKNLEEFKDLLRKFKAFQEEYAKVKSFAEKKDEDRSVERNEYIKQYSEDLSSLLKDIGIEISPISIFNHIKIHPKGHKNAIETINSGENNNPGLFKMFIGKGITFAEVYKSINPETLEINLKGFNLDSATPLEDFSSPLTYLAKIATTAEDSLLSTTTSAAGKQFWNYSLGNFLFNTSSRFKKSVYEIKSRLEDRWSNDSFYLKNLISINPITKKETVNTLLEILTFAESRDRDSNKGGKTYKDLADREFIVDSINKTLGNTNEGIINFPTFADKSVWYMMKGASLIDFSSTDFIKYDSESGLVKINTNSPDAKILGNILGSYIINEVDRIIQVQNDLETLEDDQLTVTYHYTEETADGRPDRTSGNGLKILLFPSLNNDEILNKVGLKKGEKWLENKGKGIKEALIPYIAKAMEEHINKDLSKAAENNVINFKNGKYSFITGKFDPISSAIRGIYKQDPVKMMANFSINSIIANIEATKIFSGDIAYYKNYEDLTKRIVAIIAPGSSLNLMGPSFYRAAVVKDYTLNSASLIKNYVAYLEKNLGYSKEAAERLVKGYSDVNVTDGQAYITLERWRGIMIDLGDIDRTVIEGAYQRLNDPKGQPTPEDVALVMAQPIKGMLFSRRESEVHGKAEQIPTYLKYSQAVLIPAFVENKADIGELLKAMKRDKIDEVIFESGIKTGALRPTQIADENGKLLKAEDIKLNAMVLDNRDWKLQQPLKPHETNEQLEGSQVKKNILSGIKLLEDYSVPSSYYDKEAKKWKSVERKIKGYELVEEFHEVDRALSDYEFSKLAEEWGLEWNQEEQRYSIENMEKLQESLVKDFKADDNIPEKVIQLLNLKEVNKGNSTIKEFAIAFDNNPFDDTIERKLASIITKRLVKLKMPGGSYIQTSAFGMTKPQRFTDLTKAEQTELREQMFPFNRLDAAMWDQKTGKAKGAQIFLPNYMKKFIPNNVFNNKAELEKYIKDNRLLEAIGYRIPNQGLSSIDALEIVGFLPQGYGDTIIAYDEITAKTGSDFDIDKMYVMLPSFDYIYEKDKEGERVKGEDGKDIIKGVKYINFNASTGNILQDIEDNKGNKNYIKALKNKKLELYRAILQDKNTFGELINPLDSMGVKNDAALVRFLEAKKDLLPEDIKKIESLYSVENGEFVFNDKFYKTVNNILSKNVQDLEWFGFSKQVEIRDIYLGGKFGVGQEARHMVDHAISQHSPTWKENGLESPYYFAGIDFGIGNITPFGSSDLSQVYVEGKGKEVAIASILSARLDAYVDIAKDPYIFYVNNNYLTANTVALLDRMGVNPQWTDMFTSLPIIKEYVKVTKNITAGNNPVIGETKYFKAEEYLTARLQQGINDLLPEGYKKDNLEDIRPYNLAKNKSRIKALARKGVEAEEGARVKVTDIYTIADLANMIDSKSGIPTLDNLYDQLALLKYFMELKSKATVLNKAVTASKYDTQGARGGFSQGMIFEGLTEELTNSKSPLAGFRERFERTMAGKFKEHGPDLLRQVFGEMFLLGNESYRNTLRRIGAAVGHSEDMTTNEEYIREMHRNFRSFIYTETEYYKNIDIKALLYGKDNIMARLSKAKQEDSAIKNNLLIKYLTPVGPTTNKGFVYIKAPSRIAKTGKEKNSLTNAWDALLKSPDKETRKLGEDLYKFSILSSGFKNGTFTFHELVPLDFEMETGIYDQFGKIAEYVKEAGALDIDLMSRFMISQMNNTDIVPEVDGKINPLRTANSDKKTVFVLEIKNDFSYKYQVRPLVKEDGVITQYPEYVPFVTLIEGYDNQRSLYKFEGLKESKSDKGKPIFIPIYSMIQRYNYESKGRKIYEPIDLNRESVLNENKKRVTKKAPDRDNRKPREVIASYFASEATVKVKESIQNLIDQIVTITSDDILDSNAEFFGLAPWNNNLTSVPNTQQAIEKISIYPGEMLKPEYKLENPIVIYLDSKLRKFNSIQEALSNGVSLNDAVQLAAKYNLEIQNEIQDLSDDLSYLESFDNVYEIPGYGMAVNRAKMLLDANVIGFQEVLNLEGEPVYINTRPITLFLEELSDTIEETDYLQVIKDMVNPKVENTDYQVVTFATPNNQFGGMYSEVRSTNALEGSTILMSESTSKKKNAVTLLHEMLHGFTNNELSKDSKLYKKSKALYELWYSRFKNATNMPEPLRKYINEYEQDSNNTEKEQLVIKEFVSYGLTDSNMVTQLKSIEINAKADPKSQLSLFTEKIESAFNKLLEVVLSTFNITDKNTDTNAYELLKDSIGEFISQASNLRDSKEYREQSILSILADNSKQYASIKKSIKEKSTILKQLNENIKKECR